MKTATGTVKAMDIRTLNDLGQYIEGHLGEPWETTRRKDFYGNFYFSSKVKFTNDFEIVSTMEYSLGYPLFTLWYRGQAVSQEKTLRTAFKRFADLRRKEEAAIDRAVDGIRF